MTGPPSRTDLGAQNERTSLAWERTALSLMAGAVVIARLTFDRLGALAVVLAGVSLPIALWIFVASHLRYRRDPGSDQRTHPRGGRAPAALTLVIVLLAVTELAALLVSAAS